MQEDDHGWLQGGSNTNYPKVGSNYTFVQVGANGHNANTEFNINHCGYELSILQPLNNERMGKITAVGPRLQLISEIQPLEVLSENPAIWETEPKESKDLEIYYEASGAVPISVNSSNIHEAIPIGSRIRAGSGTFRIVNGHTGMQVNLVNELGNPATVAVNINNGTLFTVIRPDGLQYGAWFHVKNVIDPNIIAQLTSSPVHPENLYNAKFKLAWHNCYSFGNGVESNRIRDNYNLPFISNGVKVSTTLENEYKEEHRKYGLIYSGIYNSVAGVNNLNQFIQAEKITKDINPIYGSIQKLHSRDSDLVTLCEDKCLRILANKDAVFNADGNTNLTATENVLGQTIPFRGEYGISTNPESFASEAYRAYFADRVRGTVMRLSMDGLTPISDAGMHDWFRDNLKLVYDGKIIGSYDDRNEEYNIKLETYPGGNPFDNGNNGGPEVWGCMNPLASNYNPQATIDDGTCILCSPNDLSATDVVWLESCCGKCNSPDWINDPAHECYDFCNSDLFNCCDNHCENESIGLWDVNSTYNIGDVVEQVFTMGSSYYIAIADVPAGQTGPGYGGTYWDDCCIFYDQSPQYGACNPVVDPCDEGGNGIPLCDISNATIYVMNGYYTPGDIVLHQGVYYSHLSTGGAGVPGDYDYSGGSKWAECCDTIDTTDGGPCPPADLNSPFYTLTDFCQSDYCLYTSTPHPDCECCDDGPDPIDDGSQCFNGSAHWDRTFTNLLPPGTGVNGGSATQGNGKFIADIPVGPQSGVILISFTHNSAPAQITWKYNGNSSNALSYPSAGYLTGMISDANSSVGVGSVDALGTTSYVSNANGSATIDAAGNWSYNAAFAGEEVVWDPNNCVNNGNCWDYSGVIVPNLLGPYADQAGGGTNLGFAVDTPGGGTMVVPKPPGSPSTLRVEVESWAAFAIDASQWTYHVYCIKQLNVFSAGPSGSSCGTTGLPLYTAAVHYTSPPNAGSGSGYWGYADEIHLHDWVFIDEYGVTKAPAGVYPVNFLNQNHLVAVGPNGVVINVTVC
jgi:hypothetical protein